MLTTVSRMTYIKPDGLRGCIKVSMCKVITVRAERQSHYTWSQYI